MLEFYPHFPINENINQTDFYYFNSGFSNVEIRNVLRLSKLYPTEEAFTAGEIINEKKDENPIRKSQIKWMPPELDKTEWIYDKIISMALRANFDLWKFDLHSIKDSIQYTEYTGEDTGGYDWHIDLGAYPSSHRKISISIQLSNSDDYEGGDLQFMTSANAPMVAPREKGTVIMFPSYLLHRVTPVTKGVRKSLVLWVGGTTFR